MNRQTQQPIEKSGVRLMTLVQNHLSDIIAEEKNNDKFIHLYNIGAYWVAFEQSACQLHRIYSQCGISLFRVNDCPDCVVMTFIREEDASSYFRKHIIRKSEPDYKVLTASFLPTEEFRRWHMKVVRKVL